MSDWHVSDEMLLRFWSSPAEVDDVTAASIEQHLTACRSCQVGLAELSPKSELDAIWVEVEDRVDRAGVDFTERLLRRFRMDSGMERLIAATPALRIGALAAVGLIVAVAVLASRAAGEGDAFLVLAPVVPTALVALSFSPNADPAGECGLATPVFGFGLVMRRALAIEVMAFIVLGIGSLFAPIDGLRAMGWLLPALALSLGTLAGSVRWTAPETAAGLTTVWLAVVALASVAERDGHLADSALFEPVGQVLLALVTVGACFVVAANRQLLFQEVDR